ncbi:MAG: AAA family ATPase [Zoogloeaceae bacterium]|nr:AAA family ATPase [Rhodocyclaceae bacterium]MCP5237255.1 AAA family ATPase [Zoogloeaceae bacterium]
MADIGSDFIRTKLSPPVGSHPSIELDRLQGSLPAILDVPLTVLVAPAGFGKTTQLARWCNAFAADGVATAWLTLDSDDDDIHQFFSYLLEAVSQACPSAAERARELIRNDPLLPYRQVLSALLNEISAAGEPVVLFLDDVHLLETRPVNEALYRLVRYAPANLHVATAGRTEPMIHVSRFQTERQLFRLDIDDLRFSEEDTRRFFDEVVGLPLSPLEVSALWRATEGWVAGIQLASIAGHGRSNRAGIAEGLAGASHEISVYLTENVLANMPRQLLDFMLRISVLDRVSGALAAEVTDIPNAAGLLAQLERSNLFLAPLDDAHEWYRFHALFLDYLRARARREISDDLPQLHDRASEYFARAGWWQEAVKHALAAGQEAKAAGWVERCAMDLIRRSALRTVIGWLGRLPERVIAGSIRLRLAQAWAFTLALRPNDAVRTLGALEQDMSTGSLNDDGDDTLRREILSIRAIIAGLTDDSPLSLRLARQVLELAPEPGSWVERIAHTALVFGLAYERGHDEARALQEVVEGRDPASEFEPTYAAVYQRCMFGLSELMAGNLVEAELVFSNSLMRGESEVGFDSPAATLPAGYLSAILYEWDELERLDGVLKRRLPTALGVCANGSASRFAVSLIRLQTLQGKVDQAFQTIERASRVGRERGWLRLFTGCQAEAIRLMLQDGEVVRANRTLDVLLRSMPRRAPSPLGSFIEVRFNVSVSMARLMLAKGHVVDAQIILSELCDELAEMGCEYTLARARVLLAAILERAGDPAGAMTTLAAALRYGQANGMVRSFLDAGDEIGAIVARILGMPAERFAAIGLDVWYAENLGRLLGLGLDDDLGDDRAAADARLADLRPRERDVLFLLSDGLSNKAIARNLSLSPETVKWHLRNIYRKLAVGSRIQAVRWAQRHASTRSPNPGSDPDAAD